MIHGRSDGGTCPTVIPAVVAAVAPHGRVIPRTKILGLSYLMHVHFTCFFTACLLAEPQVGRLVGLPFWAKTCPSPPHTNRISGDSGRETSQETSMP